MRNEQVQSRVLVTESQAETVQERIGGLPFKVNYQEEQHGASFVACIACTESQEKFIRNLLMISGRPFTVPTTTKSREEV